MTLEPKLGLGMSTVLVTAISARQQATLDEAESLLVTGSTWSSADLVAVLIELARPVTMATIESVALLPLAMAPMVQIPVTESYVPTLATAETNVSSAGSTSETLTPVALLGPLLVAVTVKVTLLFRAGVGLSTDLVMAMSADTGFTVAMAESCRGVGSG